MPLLLYDGRCSCNSAWIVLVAWSVKPLSLSGAQCANPGESGDPRDQEMHRTNQKKKTRPDEHLDARLRFLFFPAFPRVPAEIWRSSTVASFAGAARWSIDKSIDKSCRSPHASGRREGVTSITLKPRKPRACHVCCVWSAPAVAWPAVDKMHCPALPLSPVQGLRRNLKESRKRAAARCRSRS